MESLHEYLQGGTGGIAARRAKYNMEVLKTLSLSHTDEWDPSHNLYVKQAESKHDVWERLAHLVLAPDLVIHIHTHTHTNTHTNTQTHKLSIPSTIGEDACFGSCATCIILPCKIS